MEAVILCGGKGTRLREETEFRPKPLVEIGDYPILWHIMRHYRHFGVKDFVLCLGYKGSMIRDYFLNYNMHQCNCRLDMATDAVEAFDATTPLDWRISFIDTGQETLTGSRLRMALPYLKGERFFATYGDGVSNVDLQLLLKRHRENGKLATVTAVHPSSRFGELDLHDGAVRSFVEKPQVTDGWINGGFFVFEKKALMRLPLEESNVSLEGQLLEQLSAENQLGVYEHDGFWQCMDTYREMQMLDGLWKSGKAEWKTWSDEPLATSKAECA
ncbi:MAG: glucose-1-phosphate cytidylyltransferase [Alphaproteobacteria bacterium]|nr:glucose-1-phosphate cytidylyltransferase [Alphaproteobacteria bacterium]